MSELTNRSVGISSAAPAGGAEFRWTRRHVLALAVLCLAALLDTIDVTVVNVAMPAIRNSLHFSEGGLAWMVDAYMVPFGGFLLLGGRTGDLLGRRRVLVAGTAVFAAASLGSALAPSAAVMIVTRAVEGLAAAFVVPMTLAMLTSVFPAGPARTRAFSVWGGISAAAGTLGLVVGGALVSAAGWRWIFLINIPVGLIVIVAALRVLPATRRLARDGRPARRGFDLGGRGQAAARPAVPGGAARLLRGLAAADVPEAELGALVTRVRVIQDSPALRAAANALLYRSACAGGRTRRRIRQAGRRAYRRPGRCVPAHVQESYFQRLLDGVSPADAGAAGAGGRARVRPARTRSKSTGKGVTCAREASTTTRGPSPGTA